jgi:zinc transport system permease protein
MNDGVALGELLALPFMQRALIGGLLTGALGGLLGSFAVLRQLSFFSDALGHSALLGITLGILLGLNPTLVLIPFAVLFALVVSRLVERSALPTDALLNIVYSSSLAIAVVALSFVRSYKGGIHQLLFGDILGISWLDLGLIWASPAATRSCSHSMNRWRSRAGWRFPCTGSFSLCCWRWWWRSRSRRWGCC